MKRKALLIVYAIYVAAGIILLFNGCTRRHSGVIVCDPTYNADIGPIVTAKCALAGCHAPGTALPDFTRYAVLRTEVDNGRLKSYVFELRIMPPATVDTLTAAQKETLKCWLNNGAREN